MTTKAPAAVIESAPDSLEKTIYAITAEIPVQESNDANRLAYCVWGWVKERRGTLQQAITSSSIRSTLDASEITKIIRTKLEEKGIQVA